ncbi:EAL domain-containing protein [Pokkaliibacter plantistimulans]|nr:EAL domain-containing protein [Pokkaliibacter plantistimulans]
MSLRNVLFSFLAGVMLALLALTLFSAVQNYRSYLQAQLQAHAQDAATSLGIVLTNSAASQDEVTMQQMIDAVFDRGYYQRIEYLDVNGESKIVKQTGGGVDDLPDWFVRFADLPAPIAEAHVTNGWMQLGMVRVQSHPAEAYHDLWDYLQKVFFQFLAALVVVFLIMRWVLNRVVISPLQVLEQHSSAWAERRFSTIDIKPSTRELSSLVGAMNRMVKRLESIFSEQLGLIEHLRRQVSEDGLTGLLNRSAFDQRIRLMLSLSEEGARSGGLMLLQVRGLEDHNVRYGREAGDDMLKRIALRLQEGVQAYDGALLARRSGTDYAVFIPGLAENDFASHVEKLFNHVSRMESVTAPEWRDRLHLGAVYLYPQTTFDLGAAFSEADVALREAQQKGLNACHISRSQSNSRSANEWRHFLEGAIARDELLLYYQPVYSAKKVVLHHEVYVRLQDEHGVLAAGEFLPMAEQFDLLPALDRQVLHNLLRRMSSKDDDGAAAYCVNISIASLQDEGFCSWLKETFQSRAKEAARIVLEVPEYALRQHMDLLLSRMHGLRSQGVRFSIDHFGVGGVPFAYLKTMSLEYVKVHRSFVQNVQDRRESQFFVISMAQIAHGQDIMLLADGVETEAEWQQLQSLGVDGGMGYFLGRPQAQPS